MARSTGTANQVSILQHNIKALQSRLQKIAGIIETGDQRLLASDGPAGNQPPDISLAEWRAMYQLTQYKRAGEV